MANVFYHTDDIMRLRQAVNYLRTTYAPDEIHANLDWAIGLRDARPDVKLELLKDNEIVGSDAILSNKEINEKLDAYVEEMIGKVEDTTAFSELVKYLDNYANILAGKQAAQDRSWEHSAGRMLLNLGNKINSIFAKAQVAGNLSSALNQISQIPLIVAENGTINTLRAFKDIMTGKLRRAAVPRALISWLGEGR
jgi:hypothetical protein